MAKPKEIRVTKHLLVTKNQFGTINKFSEKQGLDKKEMFDMLLEFLEAYKRMGWCFTEAMMFLRAIGRKVK